MDQGWKGICCENGSYKENVGQNKEESIGKKAKEEDYRG